MLRWSHNEGYSTYKEKGNELTYTHVKKRKHDSGPIREMPNVNLLAICLFVYVDSESIATVIGCSSLSAVLIVGQGLLSPFPVGVKALAHTLVERDCTVAQGPRFTSITCARRIL